MILSTEDLIRLLIKVLLYQPIVQRPQSDFRFSNQNVNDRILKLYINKIQKHESHKKRLDLPSMYRCFDRHKGKKI
jgi:hypothetical protein